VLQRRDTRKFRPLVSSSDGKDCDGTRFPVPNPLRISDDEESAWTDNKNTQVAELWRPVWV